MGGRDQSDLRFAVAQARCFGNLFLRESARIDIPNLHSVRWHSTTDEKIATWMHALTPPMTRLRLIKRF